MSRNFGLALGTLFLSLISIACSGGPETTKPTQLFDVIHLKQSASGSGGSSAQPDKKKKKELEKLVKQGEAHLKSKSPGNYDSAIEVLKKATEGAGDKEWPESFMAYYQLGRAYLFKNQFDSAYPCITRAIQLEDTVSDELKAGAHNALGYFHLKKAELFLGLTNPGAKKEVEATEHVKRSVQSIHKAIQLNPDEYFYYLNIYAACAMIFHDRLSDFAMVDKAGQRMRLTYSPEIEMKLFETAFKTIFNVLNANKFTDKAQRGTLNGLVGDMLQKKGMFEEAIKCHKIAAEDSAHEYNRLIAKFKYTRLNRRYPEAMDLLKRIMAYEPKVMYDDRPMIDEEGHRRMQVKALSLLYLLHAKEKPKEFMDSLRKQDIEFMEEAFILYYRQKRARPRSTLIDNNARMLELISFSYCVNKNDGETANLYLKNARMFFNPADVKDKEKKEELFRQYVLKFCTHLGIDTEKVETFFK